VSKAAAAARRFSRFAGFRVGAEFFERRGARVVTTPEPRGLVNTMADLAHDKIEIDRVHPAIVPFFEDPGSLDLLIRSTWHFPFSIVWKLARGFMRLVGQFVYPASASEGRRIVTRVFGIDTARDGRADARGVIRSYADDGDVMQVVAYATWEKSGKRYMSAAFPLLGGSMTGILRLDPNGEDVLGRLAIVLTSKRDNGDHAGVWYVVGPVAFPVPFREQIELWASNMSCRPKEIDPEIFSGATIVGRHEQRFLGIRFATHRYWFRPLASAERAGSKEGNKS
jgi:hypothetical protein